MTVFHFSDFRRFISVLPVLCKFHFEPQERLASMFVLHIDNYIEFEL
uniref:Uncharacterized protein n=1 Tax=Rhizophora mucronata TaxID=61149 RepID=A0A2P2INS9_RHIMU